MAANFISLQYALDISVFVCVIGGGFFLATALFVEQDRAKADRAIKGRENQTHKCSIKKKVRVAHQA